MGIRKRIFVAFFSLIALLLFAGAISLAELFESQSSAKQLIEVNAKNTELAREMLNALQKQNGAILQMVATNANRPNVMYEMGTEDFNATLTEATQTIADCLDLDDIFNTNNIYHDTVRARMSDTTNTVSDVDWLLNTYLITYYNLDTAIKEYMTSPQYSLASQNEEITKNAYRTITPSILAISVLVVIVLMFLYFIDIYYLRPILKMNKQLGLYIDKKLPFDTTLDGSDEINELKEKIIKLIAMYKSKS